jgi:Na+/H+ antiporter NhaD/arsenite permease-like protein
MSKDRDGARSTLLLVTLFTTYVVTLQPEVLPHFVAALAGAVAVESYSRR